MARIRTIKPEFFTSAQVVECSTNARLLFVGLWCFCDDKGRHPDNARQIKMEVFPGDEFSLADIDRMVDELASNDLIQRYVVNGKRYFYVTGWHHQRIDKAQKAKHPDPSQGELISVDDNSENDLGTLPPDTTLSDTILSDTKGRECGSQGAIHERSATPPEHTPEPDKPDRPKRASRLPGDWTLPPDWRLWAQGEYPHASAQVIDREAAKFRDFWFAKSGKDGTKLDWQATWRNWMRSADERGHLGRSVQASEYGGQPFSRGVLRPADPPRKFGSGRDLMDLPEDAV